MKRLFFTLFLLIPFLVSAQDFYDLHTIQTIEITFEQSNWDALLDAEKLGDENYIMAQSVSINGEVFDSVGVKYKGNSTYSPNQTKNPFHIELDTYKDQEYQGYTDIKLSNGDKDPYFLREVLSYQILRQYMDAPLSNYANVYVNGTLIGLYSNSESVSKKFVNKRFYSKSNTFIKCNPPAGAGPQSNDFPNLVYMGQDSTDYYDSYELKSDAGWQELIDLCDTLANHTDQIEQMLDIDKVLWMHAFNNVLVNLDSYSGRFAQNYYLYRQDNQRFVPVVWDLNESFGRFSDAGSGGPLTNTTAKQRMDHLLHINDSNFPLIQKILSIPTYKRMYIAHCKTMLLENFDNGIYAVTGEALQNTISAAYQADNNKFVSYNNFISNLDNDVSGGGGGPGGGSTPGITRLMDGRNDYLLGLSDFTQVAPTISEIELGATPIINEAIPITATISNGTTAYLYFRSDIEMPFEQVEMLDDGAHNDGGANDGIYGANITVGGALNQYYVYAENNNAGMFSPQRAAHEFYSFTATLSEPTVGDLVINEFMASNDAAVADQDGEYDDWVELFNNSTESISLEGYYLSDDPEDLTKWEFPAGTVIGGKGYLTIWTDDDEEQEGLHTNFKLSAAAESVVLIDPSGTIVDEVSYIDQTTDISYGRFPNGTGNFQVLAPTFGTENGVTVDIPTTELEELTLKAIPNPTRDAFNLEIIASIYKERSISIYDLMGKVVYQKNTTDAQVGIDTSNWSSGMYIVQVEGKILKVVVD